MDRKRVGIIVYDDVELLDFCGPFEVFSATRLDEAKRREEPSPLEALLVSERSGSIVTAGGMTVVPQHHFDNCPPLDLLVTPGGWGARRECKNAVMLEWLRARAAKVEAVVGVCTGSMLLGFAGILDGLHATTHWNSLDWMSDAFPTVLVEREKHFVRDGRVFTSAGISAGLDVSLKVVEHYFGEQVARRTAHYMEYPYPDNDARRMSSSGEAQRSAV